MKPIGPKIAEGRERRLLPVARRICRRSFLSGLDREAARQAISAAVEHRLQDRNMSPVECDRMRDLARWASNL